MRKMLSITTALASLVAFYGVDVLSLEQTAKQEDLKDVTKSSVEQNKKDVSSEVKAKTKMEERICNKGASKDCGCKHGEDAALKKGARITIGGVIDSQFHKVSDDKTYHNIPGDRTNEKTPFEEFSDSNVGDYSKTSGISTDSILHIRAENTNTDLGLLYGADVQIKVPSTRGTGITGISGAKSRGAHIFASTEYGDVKAGFQDGAETMMRVDASSIAAGDGGADSNWFRKTNLEGEKGNFPFHVAPRLYSESLSMESNWLSFRDAEKYGKDFIDAQPFRLSYYSPSFMGLKFGVSYSPSYDGELFATGGSKKVQYIDPNGHPGGKVNANFLNYKWYNTANAVLKAARELNDINIGDAINVADARIASAAALTAANTAYEKAKLYNPSLIDIMAINEVAHIPAVGANPGEVPQNVHDIITQVVNARVENVNAINAANDDNARIAARGTIIYSARAAARIAALASEGANQAVIAQNVGLPANNPDRIAVVADDGIVDVAVNDIMDAAVNPNVDDVAGRHIPGTAKDHAQNAAIAAFRAAATAQSALGVNIGTAKEVYMLLATSGNYVGPNYENIVSGGVSYEYDFDDLKIKVSATGERGKVKGMDEKVGKYELYGQYNDLAAYNLGFSADYMGIKFAASYANLGKSGQPKSICKKGKMNTKKEYTYECKKDNVEGLQKDTYYWTAGAGYEFDDIYVSATYFKSKSVEAHELSDFILGAQYNLSSVGSQSSFVPYVTWHHFTTKEKDLPGGEKKDNKGDLFLAGVKFTF